MSSHPKGRRINVEAAGCVSVPTDKIIEVAYSDLGHGTKTRRRSLEDKKSEPFMGLEELFWQCYAVHPKRKR